MKNYLLSTVSLIAINAMFAVWAAEDQANDPKGLLTRRR